MRQVLLIRHGDHAEVGRVLSGRSEIGLSVAGQAQAAALPDMLALVPVASLHTSPRTRATQTIAPLAEALRMPVRTASALDEVDFGAFTGRSFAELAPDPPWQRWNAERGTVRCPGGETMAEAVARTRLYLASLAPAECPAVCMTHCDIIRGVVTDLLGLPLDQLFRFDCDPASCTTIDLDDGGRLLGLNVPVRIAARPG